MKVITASLAGVFAIPAFAQTPAATTPAPPCNGAEYRSLDFWVGEWIAEDQNGQPIGTNRITRDEYGNCVITEHFRMNDGTLIGHSVSIYRPGLKQWRQNWVDNQGSYFDLVGGPVSGNDHAFFFENKRLAETQAHQRMIFQDIRPDSFVWRWQRKAKADEPWADSWVIKYRRKQANAGAK
jgi:hypothetical protein